MKKKDNKGMSLKLEQEMGNNNLKMKSFNWNKVFRFERYFVFLWEEGDFEVLFFFEKINIKKILFF